MLFTIALVTTVALSLSFGLGGAASAADSIVQIPLPGLLDGRIGGCACATGDGRGTTASVLFALGLLTLGKRRRGRSR